MDKLALEIVYHLGDQQCELDYDTGQRWPTILSCQKEHILKFRSVCRTFRDATWLQFRDVLSERVFHLNEDDLAILNEITHHPRLGCLINTLTFGSQVFTANGLRILEDELENHPDHHGRQYTTEATWQRSLASRSRLPYDELVQFRDLYERSLLQQEFFWESGDAFAVVSDCIYRLSQRNLRSIRLYPRPCHVNFDVTENASGAKRLSFRSYNLRQHHWISNGAVNGRPCTAWRNIDRTLSAIAGLDASQINLQDLRTSSVCNVRWSMHSSIFKNPSLFNNLRTLQLNLREDEHVADYVYALSSSEESAHAFTNCLMAAPHLKSLDIEMCAFGDITCASHALAHISEQDVPFRLEHLVLEYNVQSEKTLTKLIKPHAKTLKRLLLLNSWVTEGSWSEWLRNMNENGLDVDILEIWKPCEGDRHDISIQCVENHFDTWLLAPLATEGKVVCCTPAEQWDNTYPRIGRR